SVLAGLVPSFDGPDSILLAVGILGATVMPHVVYLHSALTQGRIRPADEGEKKALARFQRSDVMIAMSVAGIINLMMLVVAASLFQGLGPDSAPTIEGAYGALDRFVGGGAALVFAVALLASGLSSSSVGTLAGQVVMQGFINRRIPIFARRALTMAPALVVLAVGVNPTDTLVISQVILSFGIPFALIPMIMISRRRDLMGALVNRSLTTAAASAVAAIIIALNAYLIFNVFTGWGGLALLEGRGFGPEVFRALASLKA
ncbi:MAG: Nramp family divalent metal transporter, partial [Dehalococcoidia bacterium]|nr:Nramp family divalent metal transporter [Dehalococcoidia bacterium]